MTTHARPSLSAEPVRPIPPVPRSPSPPPRATLLCLLLAGAAGCGGGGRVDAALVAEGKQTFRHDTFGDETKWTDALHMEQVVATVDPTTALSVGLKVDAEALPPEVVAGIRSGAVSLTDPATTVALLKLDAVLGLEGTVEDVGGTDTLTRLGVTCALCHSTVDD